MLALARSALRRASFASSASRCSTTVFTRNATKDASRDGVLTKEPVAERCLDVVEEQLDPAKELEELEQLVGEANAAKLRNLAGIPSRLGTGVVVKGVTRLRDEHQIDIEGKDLMRFMNTGVAARLDDDAFWTGLVRLRDHKIEGGDLVKFMCNSAAVKLDDDAFWTGLVRLRDDHQIAGEDLVKFVCNSAASRLGGDAFHESLTTLGRCMPGTAIARLMCNPIASRLTPDYATHLVAIVTHLNSHSLGGPGKLHTLLYNSPTASYVPQLRKTILEIDQPEELIAFLERFPSSGGNTRARIKYTLSELYDPTQTPSAAK